MGDPAGVVGLAGVEGEVQAGGLEGAAEPVAGGLEQGGLAVREVQDGATIVGERAGVSEVASAVRRELDEFEAFESWPEPPVVLDASGPESGVECGQGEVEIKVRVVGVVVPGERGGAAWEGEPGGRGGRGGIAHLWDGRRDRIFGGVMKPRIRETAMTIRRCVGVLCVGASVLTGGALLGSATGCKKQQVVEALDNYALYRNRGFEQYKAGNFAGAAASFREASNRRGRDVTSLYWWATSEMNLGRYNEAQFPLEQAYAIAPDHPEWTARVLDRLAEVYFQQGRQEKLRSFLTETTEQFGRNTRDFQRQAFYLLKIGDLDGAKLSLRKAAYFAPAGDASPYVAMADFYEAVNDQPSARQSLQYAYYIDPETPNVAARLKGYGIVLGPSAGLQPPSPTVSW